VKTREIRIFPFGIRSAIDFFCFALLAARFLLPLLHLFCFLTVALRECRFGWLSDGILPVGVQSAIVYIKTGPSLKKKMTNGAPGRPVALPARRENIKPHRIMPLRDIRGSMR
jgi:hypothetical protein